MAQDANNLIWLDMEMTGLNPDNDRIIEMAVVITDSQLEVVAESPVLVVHHVVFAGPDHFHRLSGHGTGAVPGQGQG